MRAGPARGRPDHIGGAVNAQHRSARGHKLLRESAITAAKIKNALARLRGQHGENRTAKIRDETGICGVFFGRPIVRSFWHAHGLRRGARKRK